MKISVLMAAYNAEKFITEAISSIQKQTYSDWELLIADDCSEDNTFKIAKGFEEKDNRIKVFRNSENLKKPITINGLFQKSKGDLITIHDADDISLSQRFEKIVQFFKINAEVDACGHNIQRITEKGKPLQLFRGKSSDFDKIKTEMLRNNTSGDASIFIKRNVIEELGEIFRPYFNNNMDYDLALRILDKYNMSNLKDSLYLYRNVPNSISKRIPTFHKLITQKITQYLADERRAGNKDSLTKEDFETINKLELKFSEPYLNDKTLHLREMASFFMYIKMNNTAIKYMIKAVSINPLNISNWKTLQYCIRKSILGI